MRHLIPLLAMLSATATVTQAVQTAPVGSASRHESPRHQVQLNGDPLLADPSQASRDSRELCDSALPFECNWFLNGSSAESQNGNVWETYLNWGDTGPEVIYRLEHIGGLLTLQLNSSNSTQLDLILLNACGENAVEVQPWWLGSWETISQELPAGTYYVVVDAFSWDGNPYTFTLQSACPGTDGPCNHVVPMTCGTTIQGSSTDSVLGNVWTSYSYAGETGPEVVYELIHEGGPLNLGLSSPDSNQLDLILLGGCDPASCLEMPWLVGSTESISVDYPAGTYYVVVDAYNWDGNPYTYTLTSNCPAESPCYYALPLGCNGYQHGTSDSSPVGNVWGQYLFGGETGPESVYELTHPGGLLTLRLSSTTSDQLDLLLLSACDPDSCLAQPWLVGSDEIISGTFPAGTYYVVVDAYNWDGNSYDFYLETGTCYPEASTSCHHMSTQQILTLPDPFGQAQAYYQFFLPDQVGSLARVLLNINNQNWGSQNGWVKLTLCRPDLNGWYGTPGGPWIEEGTLWFASDALPQGWAEFDISSLGFAVLPGEGYWVRLEYEPAAPGQQLSFYMGGLGGYEGFSTFSDGATWDNWWSSGNVSFDELNLCVEYGTACESVPLTLVMEGGSARLGWPAVPGQVQIWASDEAYTPGTLLSVLPGDALFFTDENAVAAGRRFYRAVHVCGGN